MLNEIWNNWDPQDQLVIGTIAIGFAAAILYSIAQRIYQKGFMKGFRRGYTRGKIVASERHID